MENYTQFESLQKNIGYNFINKNLLVTALTHSSYSNEERKNTCENYERMEFFGDSILQFLVTEMLFSNNEIFSEGKLTKIRSLLVCEGTLTKCAISLKLSEFIIMSNGSIFSGGLERPSILADVVEAIISAIYIDGGIESARKFVKKILNKYFKLAIEGNMHTDYKSALQEYVQGSSKSKIEYHLVMQDGPVHDLVFEYNLLIDGQLYGHGFGKTKKEAQQSAAKEGLEKTKHSTNPSTKHSR